jgi:hypothetical protein
VLGRGGVVEALGADAGADEGRHDPPAGAAGFGATEAPGATDGVLGATGFGRTEAVPGAGATDVTGLGAVEVLATGAAAMGARDGVTPEGFVTSGGAGIEVNPVAGPGPGGGGGCTGIVVDGVGGASSRHTRASASKLRSVLRPQMGQSHPTSNRFWWASMVCAGARSRMRSGPTAKPART